MGVTACDTLLDRYFHHPPQNIRTSSLEVAAHALQEKAKISVGANSGRRFDELARFLLGSLCYEETDYHVRLALVAMLLESKTNGEADPENAIMFWMHPDLEDMYLCPLLSVCEWIVAMSKMDSLRVWIQGGNDWRDLALFTPLDSSHSKFRWGDTPTTAFFTSTLERGAELAGILPNPAPRVATPAQLSGPGIDRTCGVSDGAVASRVGGSDAARSGAQSASGSGVVVAPNGSNISGAKRRRNSAGDGSATACEVSSFQRAGRQSAPQRRGRPTLHASCLDVSREEAVPAHSSQFPAEHGISAANIESRKHMWRGLRSGSNRDVASSPLPARRSPSSSDVSLSAGGPSAPATLSSASTVPSSVRRERSLVATACELRIGILACVVILEKPKSQS